MSTAVQTANSALRGECVMSTPVQTANSALRGECVINVHCSTNSKYSTEG